jgi:hypothetical protein
MAECNGNSSRQIFERTLALGRNSRRLLHCKLDRTDYGKTPAHTKPDLIQTVDPALMRQSVARVPASSQRLSVRNSFSDGCDITVKAIADLAKIGKSYVTFAVFNFIKMTSF